MGAVAASDTRKGRRLGRRQLAWIAIAIVALGLLGAYMAVAVFSQPLIPGSFEGTDGGKFVSPVIPGLSEGAYVFDYADGKTATLTESLGNSGTVAVTVTGVEASPASYNGLLTIADARAAVVQPPRGYLVDEQATWAAPNFRPIHLGPAGEALVVVHLLMSHCEDNGPGGTVWIDSIKVDYSVLGFPHVQDIHLSFAIAVQAPDTWSPTTCPRSGTATR